MAGPTVNARSDAVGAKRAGYGYSRGEIAEAGITVHEALKNKKIKVDMRRRTTHAENVESLKALLAPEQ
jgi:ribosomal protein L13E